MEMKANGHVTSGEIERLRGGRLAPSEVARIGRHAAACEQCGPAVRQAVPVERLLNELRVDLDEVQHLSEDELMTAADGALPRNEHLDVCAACREDVQELLELRKTMHRRRRWPYVAALAAAAAVVFVLLAPVRTPRPEPPPVATPRASTPAVSSAPPPVSGYGREDWDRWVSEAKTSRTLSLPPVLRDLQARRSTTRGASDEDDRQLKPDGTVVLSTRPQFHWSPRKSATYRVILQVAGGDVFESEPLQQPQWTPPRRLQRGREYAWQIEVDDGASRTIHPQAPDPPARFRILDEAAVREVNAARAQHPDDALLHAVILSRLGLRDEALEALRELQKSDPALAQALRKSLP